MWLIAWGASYLIAVGALYCLVSRVPDKDEPTVVRARRAPVAAHHAPPPLDDIDGLAFWLNPDWSGGDNLRNPGARPFWMLPTSRADRMTDDPPTGTYRFAANGATGLLGEYKASDNRMYWSITWNDGTTVAVTPDDAWEIYRNFRLLRPAR